ncbi:MAG: hypothetical protein QX191_06915, partial [Methylococcaceae bacterium]
TGTGAACAEAQKQKKQPTSSQRLAAFTPIAGISLVGKKTLPRLSDCQTVSVIFIILQDVESYLKKIYFY